MVVVPVTKLWINTLINTWNLVILSAVHTAGFVTELPIIWTLKNPFPIILTIPPRSMTPSNRIMYFTIFTYLSPSINIELDGVKRCTTILEIFMTYYF